jgi:hypothetical protein
MCVADTTTSGTAEFLTCSLQPHGKWWVCDRCGNRSPLPIEGWVCGEPMDVPWVRSHCAAALVMYGRGPGGILRRLFHRLGVDRMVGRRCGCNRRATRMNNLWLVVSGLFTRRHKHGR